MLVSSWNIMMTLWTSSFAPWCFVFLYQMLGHFNVETFDLVSLFSAPSLPSVDEDLSRFGLCHSHCYRCVLFLRVHCGSFRRPHSSLSVVLRRRRRPPSSCWETRHHLPPAVVSRRGCSIYDRKDVDKGRDCGSTAWEWTICQTKPPSQVYQSADVVPSEAVVVNTFFPSLDFPVVK